MKTSEPMYLKVLSKVIALSEHRNTPDANGTLIFMAEHKDMSAIEAVKTMPGDATHVKSAKFISVIGAVIMYTCGMSLMWVIATVILFMFGVMYLSPDLDLPRVGPVQRWGWLKIGWAPFEKIIPHRSRWSHGWILGIITIQLNFFIIIALLILFLRVCWLPLIEPMIVHANTVIDDVLRLHFSDEVKAFGVWWFAVAAAYHWHHKILDTFMRN